MNEPNAGFCDPTVLTRWTRGLLYTSLAVSLASVYIGSVFVMSGVVLEAVSGHEGDLEGKLRSVELEEQSGSSLLGWWWALWLIPFWGLGSVSYSVTRDLEEAGAERVEALYDIAIDGLDIALALVLLVIIRRIHQMQMGHWSRQRAEAAEA